MTLQFRGHTHVTDDLAHQLCTLWRDVVNAGGTVGFAPGVTLEAVAAVGQHHWDDVNSGVAILGTLHDGPAVVGFGLWDRPIPQPDGRRCDHVAELHRLMVHPRLQGQGAGRNLLDCLHALVAGWEGVELLTLNYRSGHGLGRFYRAAGYAEVGRRRGVIRIPAAAGTYTSHDLVDMMRANSIGPVQIRWPHGVAKGSCTR